MTEQDKELIDIVNNLIKNKELDELRQIREHKCFGCIWSRWCGDRFTCMYGRCVKGLRKIERERHE